MEVHVYFIEILAVLGILAIAFKIDANCKVHCVKLAILAHITDDVNVCALQVFNTVEVHAGDVIDKAKDLVKVNAVAKKTGKHADE